MTLVRLPAWRSTEAMTDAPAGPLLGALLFPGGEPPAIGRFRHLPGFAASPAPRGAPWSAELELGGAHVTLEPMETFDPFPEVLVAHDPRLTDEDRAVVRAVRSAVHVRVEPRTDDPLHARKRLVLAMGRALGDDGAVALDVAAQRIWTREDLEEELAHDAPLDINQAYVTHAVRHVREAADEDATDWLHSHGLAELGGVDFDILRPHPSHVRDTAGLVRAMALASVEGRLRTDAEPFGPSSLSLEVRGVPAADFMRQAAPEDARLREVELHEERRVVLCDPRARLLPAWLSKPRPSSLFQSELPEGTLVYFSTAASAMAAERARGTFGAFRALFLELSDLELPSLVKLGYPVDQGKPGQREHLWFQVHECFDDAIDATLVNSPHGVSALCQGDRGRHAIDLLSDWEILTPAGSIKPSALHVARILRKDRANIERLLAEHRARRN